MGTFKAPIDVAGMSRDRFETVEALVDTGATYTVLPRTLLEELGVVPHTRARFVLADGSEVERELGRARIRLGALEELLFAPDPVRQRLGPVPALMMRLAA